MKKLQIAVLTLAVALYCAPVFAQHGHGGNMSTGMAHSADHGTRTNEGSSSSSSHAITMDQQLAKNTRLSRKIQSLTGESAQQACKGFKNLGQCVAAAHVSKNLGINFACMKSDMTASAVPSGTTCPAGTGAKSMSLGKAIQTLSPNAKSKTEAKKATQQAEQDLKESSSS